MDGAATTPSSLSHQFLPDQPYSVGNSVAQSSKGVGKNLEGHHLGGFGEEDLKISSIGLRSASAIRGEGSVMLGDRPLGETGVS